MVNILEAQQQANKALINEIEALKEQLTDKHKKINEVEERFGVNENNTLTEEEIRELIGSLNCNPSKGDIRAVIDYFWLRPHTLKHLEDRYFRKSLVCLIYLHHSAMTSWVKENKEVKSLKEEKQILEKNVLELE